MASSWPPKSVDTGPSRYFSCRLIFPRTGEKSFQTDLLNLFRTPLIRRPYSRPSNACSRSLQLSRPSWLHRHPSYIDENNNPKFGIFLVTARNGLARIMWNGGRCQARVKCATNALLSGVLNQDSG